MESRNALKPDTILKGKAYQYRIIKVLGQGSFGITYLATVKMEGGLGAININVAIKEFFMGDINGRVGTTVTSGSSGGLYEDYKRKFIREADNLSKLQHPNIIKVIEAFEANNTVYYAMEYIDGGSLDDYISKRHGLQEGEAIRIAKQIGDALSFMHSKGMLHLDMKPGNIMMKSSGEVVLIDFGLSKQYTSKGEPESSTKVGAGTPGYAPLEQANYREGKGFPVTMDVYALGATLFKMLTGIRPPEASEILNEGFPANELQARHVSHSTIASIAKAMAPTKKERYQTVDDFTHSFVSEETKIEVTIDDDHHDIGYNSNDKGQGAMTPPPPPSNLQTPLPTPSTSSQPVKKDNGLAILLTAVAISLLGVILIIYLINQNTYSYDYDDYDYSSYDYADSTVSEVEDYDVDTAYVSDYY